MTDNPDLLQTILVTGGTGSFGSAFARYLLVHTSARVRLLSRDEHKQNALAQELPPNSRMTYIIADIRDATRLRQAVDGCTAIVHAAALKTVPGGERHASEFARTNIGGTDNVIQAALEARIPRTLLISSDKSVNARNLYGSTKAVAESLIIQANVLGVSRGCAFSVVRGGNVWASNGSVAPLWRGQLARGERLTVTDPDATRFNLLMPEWTKFCYWVVRAMRGGEIFSPKPAAWRLGDLADAWTTTPGDWQTIGPRDGDKPHETLISADESPRVIDAGPAYVIEPPIALREVWNYKPWEGTRMPPGWAFTSDTARRMTEDELTQMIGEYYDADNL